MIITIIIDIIDILIINNNQPDHNQSELEAITVAVVIIVTIIITDKDSYQ